MDGSTLDKAYSAAKNADAATIVGDYTKAATLHGDAGQLFQQVAEESPHNPALGVLKALAAQHRSKAAYFSSGKARADAARALSTTQSVYPNTLASQLSAARGTSAGNSNANGAGTSPSSSTSSSIAQSVLSTSLNESVGQVVAKGNQAFLKSFEAAIAASRTDPSESFYLVGANAPEDKGEIPGLAHALEAAARVQRQTIKTGLSQLFQDLANREQKVADNHQEEVDRLRAENDKLKVQVSKLKSRWDGLKESARKRREDPIP